MQTDENMETEVPQETPNEDVKEELETTSEENETTEDAGETSIPNQDDRTVDNSEDPVAKEPKKNRAFERIQTLTAKNHKLQKKVERLSEELNLYQSDETSYEDDWSTLDQETEEAAHQQQMSPQQISDVVAAQLVEHERKRTAHNVQTEQQQIIQNELEIFSARLDVLKESKPDADKVWNINLGPDSAALQQHIRNSKNGPEMAYEIVSDLNLQAYLQQAPIHEALIQLGRLESTIALSKQKEAQPQPSKLISNAPPPIDTVSGTATSPAEVDLADLDFDEYKKARGL